MDKEKIIEQAKSFKKIKDTTIYLDNTDIIKFDYTINNYFRLYDLSPFDDEDDDIVLERQLNSLMILKDDRIDNIYNQISKTKNINFDQIALVIYNKEEDKKLNYHIGDITLLVIGYNGKGLSVELFKENEPNKYRLGIIRKDLDANELLYNKKITFPTSVKYGDFNRHYITKREYANRYLFCKEVAEEYKCETQLSNFDLPEGLEIKVRKKVYKNKVNN